MSQTTPTAQTGRPGRYQRSASGLVASIIVLVAVVLGIVVFRAAFRQTPSYEPDHLDYRALVASVQQAGLKPAYPPTLPRGWYVKDASFVPGDRPVLDLAMTTADGHFAGLHEEDRAVGDLVDTYVGGGATEGDKLRVSGGVAPVWQSFSDTGGDHGFAAEVGHQTVLVYGDADVDQLRALVRSLTTAKLKP